jgi:hypothetical protein
LSSNGTENWDRGSCASAFSKSTDFENAYPSDTYAWKNNDLLFSKIILELIFSKNTAAMAFEKNGKLIYIWI